MATQQTAKHAAKALREVKRTIRARAHDHPSPKPTGGKKK